MRIAWYGLFCSSIVAGLAGAIVHAAGRADLAPMFGAAFTILMGLTFLHGCYVSVTTIGEAWVIGVGWVTRKSNPLAYWAGLSVSMLLGFLTLVIGIYWCSRLAG